MKKREKFGWYLDFSCEQKTYWNWKWQRSQLEQFLDESWKKKECRNGSSEKEPKIEIGWNTEKKPEELSWIDLLFLVSRYQIIFTQSIK